MEPVAALVLLAVAALLAGIAGSYLGIGGGIFLVPFMALVLQASIKVAIATSLIGVIATSSGAASVYVRDHLTNLRLAMFLEVATTMGAIAGAVSGLLGVGGGFIKVPAMNLLMRVPMKAAVATSNFMIGVTAAASAFIYYSEGLVNPAFAAMVIIGVFTGTHFGTRWMARAKAANVRFAFAVCLVGLGLAMLARLAFPGVP